MATALDQLTGMPTLPVTSGLMGKMPAAPKGYVGPKEIAPAMEELRGAEAQAVEKVGKADVAIEEAKRAEKATELEQRAALTERFAKEERELPERQALKEARQDLEGMKFVPTRESAQDLAAFFGLIGVIGMVGAKGNALKAMNAMDGMLKGYREGKKEQFRQEQIEFDKNFKAMQAKIQTLEKELTEAMALKVRDREAGELQIQAALAKSESPLLKAMKDKQGDVAVLSAVRGARKDLDTMVNLENKLRADADKRVFQEEKLALQREIQELRSKNVGKAGQQQFIAQRAVTALRGAASTMESVMQLPASANVGFLPFLSSKEGMMNYVKNAGGRKMSSQEAKAVETLYSGMSRYLATIEASGTATGLVGLANQLEKIYPKSGDSVADVALKIADTRRIATEAVAAMVESGLLPGQQAEAAKEQIKRFEKAVPFTTNDVIQAQFGGKKTIGTAAAEAATPKTPTAGQPYSDAEKERRYQEWKARQPQ